MMRSLGIQSSLLTIVLLNIKNGVERLSGNKITKDKHVSFDTVSDFEDYITGSNYEDKLKLCFGVYFKEESASNYRLELRYNITETFIKQGRRRIGEFVDIFNLDSNPAYNNLIVSPSSYLDDFYRYGFLSLMNLADNYLLQQKHSEGYIEGKIYPMRFDSYLEDTFLEALGNTLVFFLIVTFLIPVCRFISALVSDKENRTK